MEHSTIMLLIAILLPVVSALLLFAVKNHTFRNLVIIATALILTVNSFLLFTVGDIQFTPSGDLVHNIIMALDFALLLYVLYAGIMRKNALVIVFGLLQLIPLAYFEFSKHAHFAVSPAFYVDTLAKIMIVVISFIGSVICVYGLQYIKDHEQHLHLEKSRQGRFLFWTVVFLGAMNGLVASNSLYYLYFFWEVTTVCSYMLIGHDLTKQALANAARALWINSLGGTAFCFAILYLYTYCGGHDALSLLFLMKKSGGAAISLLLPVSLLCFAGFTKSAQFPFQSWLLGAMVAPTPVSALLHSSTMVKAGVYLVLRLMPLLSVQYLGKSGLLVGYAIALVGAFTFLAGSLLAISQTTGKKVLAYSTIANLGLIIACAGINTPISLTAAIMLIVFHAVSKALLFLCAGTVEHIVWSREIDDMQGLAEKAPLLTLVMGLGILTMFLPPFGMLLSKWMAVEAAASVNIANMGNKALIWGVDFLLVMILGMFAFASAATMVFWGKWLGAIIQSHPGFRSGIEKFKAGYSLPLWVLLVSAVLFSLMVGHFYKVISLSVANIMVYGSSYAMIDANLFQTSIIPSSPDVISRYVGAYPVLTLFLLLGGIIGPWIFKKVKQAELTPAYICGDNADMADVSSDQYMTAGDKKEPVKLSSYYFMKYFGEASLNPKVNAISLIFIFFMFGIVLGVSI